MLAELQAKTKFVKGYPVALLEILAEYFGGTREQSQRAARAALQWFTGIWQTNHYGATEFRIAGMRATGLQLNLPPRG